MLENNPALDKNTVINLLYEIREYFSNKLTDDEKAIAESRKDLYAKAADQAIREINFRIPGMDYGSQAEKLDSAIISIEGLLSYHERVSLVTNPNFLADIYALSLSTALESLKKEREALS